MGKDTKNLVLEVSAGIVLFTLVAMAVAGIVYPRASVFLGLLLGMVLALAMFLSMAEIMDRSMRTGDAATVQKRTVIGSVVRYIVLFAVLVIVVVWFPDRINAVALVIGVLGLKAGAYLQPAIHRVLFREKRDGQE